MGALVEGLPPYPPSPMLGYALQCSLYFVGDGSLFISPQNAPRINFNIGEGGKGGVCVPSCSTPPNHSVVDSCCPMVVYLSRHGTLCEPSDLSFSFPSPLAPLFKPHSHIQMPSTYEPHSNDTWVGPRAISTQGRAPQEEAAAAACTGNKCSVNCIPMAAQP